MAVEVKAAATMFEAARSRQLFQTRAASQGYSMAAAYDVTDAGQRFLIETALETEGPAPPIPSSGETWPSRSLRRSGRGIRNGLGTPPHGRHSTPATRSNHSSFAPMLWASCLLQLVVRRPKVATPD